MGCILIEVLFKNFLEEENIFLTLPENHRAGAGEHADLAPIGHQQQRRPGPRWALCSSPCGLWPLPQFS